MITGKIYIHFLTNPGCCDDSHFCTAAKLLITFLMQSHYYVIMTSALLFRDRFVLTFFHKCLINIVTLHEAVALHPITGKQYLTDA